MTIRLPTPEEAIKSAMRRVVSYDREWIVSELLRRRVPSNVLSQFWGGGARLKQMKNQALARGLERGFPRDRVIRAIVQEALVRYAFQSSLSIRIAGKRWAPDGAALPESALRWLAERSQPLHDDIVVWSLREERPLPEVIPGRAAEVERLGWALLPDPPLTPAALLARVREDAGGTILQVGMPLLSYDDELVLGHLARGAMEEATSAIGVPPDAEGAVAAAIVCALAGDLERAVAFAPEPSQLGPLPAAAVIAIRAMDALRRENREEIEASLKEVRPRAVLSTVAGLLELHLDRPLEAALSFAKHYATEGDTTAFGIHLAVACLDGCGQRVPDRVAATSARGYAIERERRHVQEAIEALLPRTGILHDAAHVSEIPPAPPVTPAESRPTDELGARITEIQHRNAELRDHLARGELARVAPLAAEIEQLRTALSESRAALIARVSETVPSFSMLPMPDDVLASSEAASAWLFRVDDAIAEHTESATRALEEERGRLRAALVDLKIDVPAELETARSVREVQKLRRHFGPQMEVATAIRHQDARFDGNALCALGIPERVEVYVAIARRYPSEILERVLHEESETLLWDRRTPGLLLEVLSGVVEQMSLLPRGTWALIDNLIDGDPMAMLAERGLLPALAELSVNDLAGLDAILGDRIELLPPATQHRVRQRRAASLRGDARVRALAALMRDVPADHGVLKALLEALLAEGRSAEALLLASVGARCGLLDSKDAGTLPKRVAIAALLDSTEQRAELVAELLLGDVGWLTSTDEEVALLAWLLRRSADLDPDGAFADALVNLRYRVSSRLDAAERRFPGLMRRVFPVDSEAPDQAARNALEELDRDLGKLSCYSNWLEARRYQDYFRKRIEVMLATTPVGRIDAAPDELIDEAQAESDLIVVEGEARNNMRRFLAHQLSRLEILRESGASVDELRGDAVRIDLAAEAATVEEDSPLRSVYRRLEEEVL